MATLLFVLWATITVAQFDWMMAGYAAEAIDPEHFRCWQQESQMKAIMPHVLTGVVLSVAIIALMPRRKR